MADGPLARFFWRILDGLDYWIMQAKLWVVDMVCGPLPGDGSPDRTGAMALCQRPDDRDMPLLIAWPWRSSARGPTHSRLGAAPGSPRLVNRDHRFRSKMISRSS
jgi:hypothetical protein